jgi:integrase
MWTNHMTLEPIEPENALELYLADRENNVTVSTIRSHRSRLGHLIRWCDDEDITNLNELTGRLLHQYRIWRRNEGDLAKATEKTQMDTVRVFIKWLESIDAVEENLHRKVLSPTLSGGDNVREDSIESQRMELILDYLSKFEYASRPHVALKLMWHTMMRIGAVQSLDLEDYDSENQSLRIIHRPDSETTLKNQSHGERLIALSEEVCAVLDDWIEHQRPAVTDDHGRDPLLTTSYGRVATGTLRKDCYQYTRPCILSGECPHGRDLDDCEATNDGEESKCPSSLNPHAFRRGGITHALQNDWPLKAVSDRANVTKPVLEKHYDVRSEEDKMENRREHLDSL